MEDWVYRLGQRRTHKRKRSSSSTAAEAAAAAAATASNRVVVSGSRRVLVMSVASRRARLPVASLTSTVNASLQQDGAQQLEPPLSEQMLFALAV